MPQYAKFVGIRTWGSHSVFPRQAKIWCRFGDKAFQKRAEDVKPGDRVLERGTKISLSLQDIKNALLEDEITYQTAHRQLHALTDEGEKTKLQVFLTRILEKEGKLKTQKENVQIIRDRLEKVAKLFAKIFPQATHHLIRSESAIAGWLSGQTVLPSDFRVLRVLRKLDPLEFDSLFGKPAELKPSADPDPVTHPLAWAHGYWSTVHKTLRRWVEGQNLNPDAAESEEFELPEPKPVNEKTDKPSINLDSARTVVHERLIQHIAEKIDSDHKFTRVKDVEFLTPSEERQHKATDAPTISRGVISAAQQPIEPLGIQETTARDVFREHIALGSTLTKLLQHERIPEFEGLKEPAGGWGEPIKDLLRFTENTKKHGKEIPLFLSQDLQMKILKLPTETALAHAQKIRQEIESGKIDRRHGLPVGTFKKIYQRMTVGEKYDPIKDLFFEHNKKASPQHLIPRLQLLSKQQRKDEFAEIKRLADRIGEYGVQPGSFGSPIHYGVKTKKEYEQYVKTHMERMRETGLKHFGFEPPIAREELAKYFQNMGLENKDVEKLLDIYGKENFLED